MMHVQNENINKQIETIFKKTQTKITQLKNTINELKNSREEFIIRFDQAEEDISKLEDRSFEIIESEEQKEKKNE